MAIKHRNKVSKLLRNGWAKPGKSTRMLPDEVQVWRLDLSCSEGAAWVEAGWDLLSPDEVERARRLRAGKSRDELVAGRAALRHLLARELRCCSEDVEFSTGAHGKPLLVEGGIEFNVAHSQGMILIALSRAGRVGIDVEDVARPVEALDVARTAFHPEESHYLNAVDEAVLPELFYRMWTRKEAVAKADGRGLALAPQSFSLMGKNALNAVSVVSDQKSFNHRECFADDVEISGKYHENNYRLIDLDPGEGFVATLASSQRTASIAQYDVTYLARDPKRGTSLVHPFACMH